MVVTAFVLERHKGNCVRIRIPYKLITKNGKVDDFRGDLEKFKGPILSRKYDKGVVQIEPLVFAEEIEFYRGAVEITIPQQTVAFLQPSQKDLGFVLVDMKLFLDLQATRQKFMYCLYMHIARIDNNWLHGRRIYKIAKLQQLLGESSYSHNKLITRVIEPVCRRMRSDLKIVASFEHPKFPKGRNGRPKIDEIELVVYGEKSSDESIKGAETKILRLLMDYLPERRTGINAAAVYDYLREKSAVLDFSQRAERVISKCKGNKSHIANALRKLLREDYGFWTDSNVSRA